MKIEVGEIIQMNDLRLFVVTEVRPKEVIGMNLNGKGTKYRIKHKDIARTVGLITEDLDSLFSNPEMDALEEEHNQRFAEDMASIARNPTEKRGWEVAAQAKPGEELSAFINGAQQRVIFSGVNPRAKKYPIQIVYRGKRYKVAAQNLGVVV